MKIKNSDLNNASVIILDAGNFLKIKVDKVENKVTELIHTGIETNKDVTKEVLIAESKYTIGDMVVGTPYTLGMVVAKLLNNTADLQCKKTLLHIFDKIKIDVNGLEEM